MRNQRNKLVNRAAEDLYGAFQEQAPEIGESIVLPLVRDSFLLWRLGTAHSRGVFKFVDLNNRQVVEQWAQPVLDATEKIHNTNLTTGKKLAMTAFAGYNYIGDSGDPYSPPSVLLQLGDGYEIDAPLWFNDPYWKNKMTTVGYGGQPLARTGIPRQ